MTKNVGAFDGFFRMLIGTLLVIWGVYSGPWWISIFSVIFYGSALSMWCPLYELVGMNTDNK